MAKKKKRPAAQPPSGWSMFVVVGIALLAALVWQLNAPESLPAEPPAGGQGHSWSLGGFLEELGEAVQTGLAQLDAPDLTPPSDIAPSPSGESAGALPPPATADGSLRIHFIDVGQAEAILVQAPEATLLIDAGENNQGSLVTDYLAAQGVDHLDWVIGTHAHSDHIGGMDYVIEHCDVRQVMLYPLPPELTPSTKTYLDLLQAIDDKGLQITPAEPGLQLDLGGGALLTVLGPLIEVDDQNELSIVCRIDFGQTSALLTGDCETESEQALLDAHSNLQADLLGVGHHGSKTSTSQAFLQQVEPQFAAISVGLDNSYGHPGEEVLQRLEKAGAQIWRTDIHGSIVFTSDGSQFTVQSEK